MGIYFRQRIGRLLTLMIVTGLVSGCASTSGSQGEDVATMQFDRDSWKTMIADECRSFFDGCNICRREPGKEGLCTLKACEVYQKPRCLDEE